MLRTGIVAIAVFHATGLAAGGTPNSCSIVDFGAVSGDSDDGTGHAATRAYGGALVASANRRVTPAAPTVLPIGKSTVVSPPKRRAQERKGNKVAPM